ncbi:MAG TPA: hypothetical protein VJ063_09840 [Verrucomicrobiae bacterium]|nr:hypothetical protein [Verrucomicrobiae bacterium]
MGPDVSSLWARLLLVAVLALSAESASAVAPVNDRCGGAIIIPTNGPFPHFTVPVDITEATTNNDPAPPTCAFSDLSRSVWYSFRPANTDVYRISTCGETGATNTVRDTLMAVYTNALGNACGQPYFEIPWGCNDDLCGKNSEVSAIFTAGITYYIVVWQYGVTPPLPGQGLVGLMVERGGPSNDDCSNPQAVQLNIPVLGRTLYARNDYDFGNSTCFTGIGHTPVDTPGRDVVFTFTAPATDNYSFKVKNYNMALESDYDLVLYVSPVCPEADPGASMNDCLAAANRNTYGAEEVLCLPLTNSQRVYVFVDDRSSVNRGSSFTLEVVRCIAETEGNSSIFAADPYSFEITGGVLPVNDPDYYALGSFPPGSRAFAMIDASSANIPDFDLRVVNATDTLEYDTDNNDVPFGNISGSVAGTPLTGDCTWLRVSHVVALSEPYRLYAIVQPPSSNAVAEVEPNGTIQQANFSAKNYFYGTLPNSADEDMYSFDAVQGDLIFLSLDADPLRDRTPIDTQLELLNSAGAILMVVDDANALSNTNTTPGRLDATRPFSPAESIVCRATYTGRYYVRVLISPMAPVGANAGDYLLSISRNGFVGTGTSNTPPRIANFSAPSVPKTTNAVVSGLIVDPDPGPKFKLTVNWGDATPSSIIMLDVCQYAFEASHPYAQAGSYLVTVIVQDAQGATRSTNTTIQITNPTAAPATIKSVSYRPDRSVLINLEGTPAAIYRIEVSETLQGWGPLTTRTADSAGKFQVIDGPVPPLPQRRFYRAVWP